MQQARRNGQEISASDPTPAVGKFLKFSVNLLNAKSVVEIGTGSGVGGLWLLSGMTSDAVLTTIDSEREHSKIAKTIFDEADIAPTRYRIITGKLIEVIGKLADNSYDLIIIRPALDLFDTASTYQWRLIVQYHIQYNKKALQIDVTGAASLFHGRHQAPYNRYYW